MKPINRTTSDEVMRQEVLRRTKALFGSQTKLAKHLDISASYVSDCMLGRRHMHPGILDAVGIKRSVVYEWD